MLAGRTVEAIGAPLDRPAEKRFQEAQQVARLPRGRRLLGFALLALPVDRQRCGCAVVADSLDQPQHIMTRNRRNWPLIPQGDEYPAKVPRDLRSLSLPGLLRVGSDDLKCKIILGHRGKGIRLELQRGLPGLLLRNYGISALTDQFQPAASLFPGLLKGQFAIDAQLPPCGVLVAGIAGHQNKGSTPRLGDADA